MRPLEDIRIVALEQYGAGPFGSLHLADLGAEVIKLEDPKTGGDVGRYVPPYQEGEDSLFFETFNRNKRSLGLDLSHPDGRVVFEHLVGVSDGIYSNLRGDVPAKLGLRYADLKGINPRIVCCSLTGFGTTGSRRDEPGYDYILQGLAGWMSLTGEPDSPPTKAGLSLVDYCGGFVAALALLAGLLAARRDGHGMDCDVSLFDTAVSLLTYPATWYLTKGYLPSRTRHSAHPTLVPFQNFETRDGWIVIACAKEKFWRRLTAAIGRPGLAEDPRFGTFSSRRKNAYELVAILSDVFSSRGTTYWIRHLTKHGVPCGPVNSVASALDERHTRERQMVVETRHPRFGVVRQVASPVRVGAGRTSHRPAPRRNEDFAYVLHDVLGYDAPHIEQLARSGAFGSLEEPSVP